MSRLQPFLARAAVAVAVGILSTTALAAADAPVTPEREAADPDYAAARKAIDAKRWAEAVGHLEKSLARKGSTADVENLLGYAERNRGNLDAAFAHYEKALKLDPKHKGAHEYVGEAYLMVGNLAKAKEHLAALDKLCFITCEEYRDLKKRVAAYEREHGAAAAR